MRQDEARVNGIESYISVDIEASGSIPGKYSLLSIGACLVDDLTQSFYVELAPITQRADPKAIAVTHLSLDKLSLIGVKPKRAMTSFRDWIVRVAQGTPIFVGFNASFDWSFVNWYFHRFLNSNPFGIGCVDIKSFYMGLAGCLWRDTSSSRIPSEFSSVYHQTHHALDDARAQAEMFRKMLDKSKEINTA